MEPSDTSLVAACRTGDPQAWEVLVQRYQRLIYTIPRRAGLTEDQAADVFQRVFTLFIERIDQIQQPERVGAWLATTARREAWRISRQSRATIPLPGADNATDEPFDIPDTGLLPDEQIEQIEQQQQIRRALNTLDPRCQQLLTLLFYQLEPPAYADIAQQLGTTEGSIGPTRARCLQKLRKLLDESGF
jgi:RNA polymerase sigma factor (sigma-70 family)